MGMSKKLMELIDELENRHDEVLLDESDLYLQDRINDYDYFGSDHMIEGVKYFKGLEIGRLEKNKEVLERLKRIMGL